LKIIGTLYGAAPGKAVGIHAFSEWGSDRPSATEALRKNNKVPRMETVL
jgi:hypothetical protein